MILTAEADNLPTDEKGLLDDYGSVGCRSSRSNDLSVHARIDPSGFFRLLWEADDRNGHAAIFEVKFGKKRQIEQPQNRASDRLSSSLTLWSLLR